MIAMIVTMIVIQIGDRTQNQDHVIYPVNLSAMNRIVSKPTKPIPLEELDEDDDEDIM